MYGELIAVPTISGRLTIPTSSSAVLIDKIITDNGVYNASDDSADGYKKVTVTVQGSDLVPITQSDYDALSEEEKMNGDIYQISGVSELIDMTGATTYTETAMTITNGNGSVSFSRGTGSRIGCNTSRSLDVTNIETIEYNLAISTFYGGGNCNNDPRALYIGVASSASSNMFTWYITSPLLFNSHMLANKTYLNERLDVSALTGIVYFNIQGNGVIMDMTQIKAYSNLSKLMYMGNEYIKK